MRTTALHNTAVRFVAAICLFAEFFYPLLSAHAQGAFVPVQDEVAIEALAEIAAATSDTAIATDATAGSTATIAAASTALTKKELLLDGIVFAAINGIIDQLGNDLVEWINNGFEAGPAFLSDPGGFFMSVGDQVVAKVVNDLDLDGLLCGPFGDLLRFNINLQFGLKGRDQTRLRCGIYEIGSNILNSAANYDAFVSGNFNANGGWNSWATLSRGGNPYHQSLEASIEVDRRLARAFGIEKEKLSWGKGFFSDQGIDGYIKTPGSVVEAQLNNQFDSGRRRIEVADEISEIVGALINLAMQKLMGGLLKTSGGANVAFATNYQTANNQVSNFDYNAYNLNLPVAQQSTSNKARSTVLQASRVYPSDVRMGPIIWQTATIDGVAASNWNVPNSCNGPCDANRANNRQTTGLQGDYAIAISNDTVTPTIFPYFEMTFAQTDSIERIRLWQRMDATWTRLRDITVTFFDNNGAVPATCDSLFYIDNGTNARITRTSAQIPSLPSCHFTIPSTNTDYFDLHLSTPAHANRLIITSNYLPPSGYTFSPTLLLTGIPNPRSYDGVLALSEVEVFRRPIPILVGVTNTSLVVNQAFNPLSGITALDADKVSLNPAGLTYTVKDSSGNVLGTTVAAINTMRATAGIYTITYIATDRTGLASEPVIRNVRVTSSTGANPNITLNTTTSGRGNITGNGINCGTKGVACSISVAGGTAITLTATADPGATFSRWTGSCIGASATCSFLLNASTSAGAIFNTTLGNGVLVVASAMFPNPTIDVRGGANPSATVLGTQPHGAQGVIVGNAVTAGSSVWWNVNFNTGNDGWINANELTAQ
jgi:hypothetical protein